MLQVLDFTLSLTRGCKEDRGRGRRLSAVSCCLLVPPFETLVSLLANPGCCDVGVGQLCPISLPTISGNEASRLDAATSGTTGFHSSSPICIQQRLSLNCTGTQLAPGFALSITQVADVSQIRFKHLEIV